MRLLQYNNDSDFSLTEVFEGDIPKKYAILSHRWGAEEVTFKDLIDGTSKGKAGYGKIQFCGEQARRDGLQYFWVDTCCIDKSNAVELQEAINSMFRWYQNAAKCYVYLLDVSTKKRKASDRFSEYTWESAFRSSRWFTRGWTLQELLAPGPDSVEFFSQEGDRLGNKRTLEPQIHEITGIPITALRGTPLSQFDVDDRLLWAETRQATHEEDRAYSLFGIFDIQIPLRYGEGRDKALKRLREEIDKPLKGDLDDVNFVVFSPDGNQVVSGSWDKTVRLWNAGTGAALQMLEGRSSGVSSVTSSPDMTAQPMYSLLNEDEDEVRLITILPYVARLSLVECTLEILSLKALTAEYRDFSSASNYKGRKQVVEWTNMKNVQSSTSANDIVLDKHNPDHQSHRFTWGDYAALSYVWGDPADTKAIILNNTVIQVQQNLEAVLRTLSSRAEFHGNFRLWVDAICINQNDMKEKSRQILKMRTVYGNASEVVAWLGEEVDDSSKAFDLLQVFNDARTKDCGQLLEERLQEDHEYLGFGGWKALHELMRREYWFRLWIIQEVVLGSSAGVVCCGNRVIPWKTFCQGIGFLFEYLWTAKDPILAWEARRGSLTEDAAWGTTSLHLVFRDLWVLSRNEEDAGKDHLSFGQLLDLGKSGKSQDKRDKVYGLIGMMDPLVAESVIPDYTFAPSKVYAAIAKTFISVHENLEAIREGNPWGKTRSPSWAADWTWDGRIRFARITAYINGPFWRSKGLPPDCRLALPYSASGEKPMEACFSDDGLYLTCRGFLVDEVDGLSAREDGYFAWAERTIHQPKSEKNAYGSSEGVIEALYRTLVLDRVAGGVRASQRHAAILTMPSEFWKAAPQFRRLGWTWLSKQEGYYFRWSGWRLANSDMTVLGKRLDEYFSETIPQDANEYDHTEAYSCNNRTSHGRRFITTMNGYIGWGPDNMYDNDQNQVQPGDKIAILFGCSTPIVVRPQGGHFQVLGEAYIHGLMDGEAIAFPETGRGQAQFFTFK